LTNQKADDDRAARARRAHDRFHAGSLREAWRGFDALLAEDPDDAWALAHRAETRLLLGDPAGALLDFDRALAIRPDYAWAHAHRGACLRAAGRREEARDAFDRALTLRADNAWTLVHRANMEMALGRFDRALEDLDRALALDPEAISHAAGERGLILNALGRYDACIAGCSEALAKDSDDFVAAYSLAVARLCRDDDESARQAARTLRDQLTAADPDGRDHARVYRRAGLSALLGEGREALALLARVVPADEECSEIARHDPAWRDLRGDPAFERLWAAAP